MKEFHYPAEIKVTITNRTDRPVCLNTEPVLGGVVLHKGTTYIDGDRFFIVQRYPGDMKLKIETHAHGITSTKRIASADTLTGVGSASGLIDIRCFARNDVADINVTITEAV